jgi:hypothetical protein
MIFTAKQAKKNSAEIQKFPRSLPNLQLQGILEDIGN